MSAENLQGYFIVLPDTFNNNCNPTVGTPIQEVPTNPIHSCTECNYRTNIKDDLQSHYWTAHIEKFVFDQHTNRFILKENLNPHTETIENVQHINTPMEKFVFVHRSKRTHLKENWAYDKPAHLCDICGKRYMLKKSFLAHMKAKHPVAHEFPCTICGQKLMTRENLNIHLYLDHGNTHKCVDCGIVFGSEEDLKEHAKVHSRDLPNTCAICKTVFPSAEMRRLHVRVHPSESRVFSCNLCSQMFHTQCAMFAHKTNVHHPNTPCQLIPIPVVRVKNNVQPRPVQIIVAANAEVTEEILP